MQKFIYYYRPYYVTVKKICVILRMVKEIYEGNLLFDAIEMKFVKYLIGTNTVIIYEV